MAGTRIHEVTRKPDLSFNEDAEEQPEEEVLRVMKAAREETIKKFFAKGVNSGPGSWDSFHCKLQ